MESEKKKKIHFVYLKEERKRPKIRVEKVDWKKPIFFSFDITYGCELVKSLNHGIFDMMFTIRKIIHTKICAIHDILKFNEMI